MIPTLGNYFSRTVQGHVVGLCLTLQELLFSGQIIISRTYDYFTIYTMVLVLYFLVGYPALIFVRYLEKLTKAGYRRRRRPESLPLPNQPS